MVKQERQSNVELLRILLMLGVIILHYNGVGGALYSAHGINYFIVIVFESLFICAVDLFMLISGYFSCKSTKTVAQKPIQLVLQVILISAAFCILSCIFKSSFSAKSFIGSLIPANYFVILYVVVYLLSPYLNLLYDKMNTKLIVILLLLFSVYPTLVDVFKQLTGRSWDGLSTIGLEGSQAGYTIVNFILMYFVGMYIKKNYDSLKKIATRKLLAIFGLALILIIVWSMATNYFDLPANLAWEYCNPLVIIEAITVFMLFSRLDIGSIKWVNKLSSACFTVYLVHSYFITHIKVEWAVLQNPVILIVHMILAAVIIYLICYCIFIVYDLIMRIVLKKFDSKEIVITEL